MKKFIISLIAILAAALLLLTGCAAPAPEKEFQPDLELLQERIRQIFSLNWVALYGETWGRDYTGFQDASELESDRLLNFFFRMTDDREYLDAESGKYRFTAADVQRVLDEYFDHAEFRPQELTREAYPTLFGDDPFFTDMMYSMSGSLQGAAIDSWNWDAENHLLTVCGGMLALEEPGRDGSTVEAVFYVDPENARYLLRSFLFMPAPVDIA